MKLHCMSVPVQCFLLSVQNLDNIHVVESKQCFSYRRINPSRFQLLNSHRSLPKSTIIQLAEVTTFHKLG